MSLLLFFAAPAHATWKTCQHLLTTYGTIGDYPRSGALLWTLDDSAELYLEASPFMIATLHLHHAPKKDNRYNPLLSLRSEHAREAGWILDKSLGRLSGARGLESALIAAHSRLYRQAGANLIALIYRKLSSPRLRIFMYSGDPKFNPGDVTPDRLANGMNSEHFVFAALLLGHSPHDNGQPTGILWPTKQECINIKKWARKLGLRELWISDAVSTLIVDAGRFAMMDPTCP